MNQCNSPWPLLLILSFLVGWLFAEIRDIKVTEQIKERIIRENQNNDGKHR